MSMQVLDTKNFYDILFDLSNKERQKADMEKLNADFFKDNFNLIKEEETQLEKLDEDGRRKKELFIHNARRMLKEIYERRIKKVTQMALNKSKTGTLLIDTSNMLSDEHELFKELVEVFDKSRSSKMNLFYKPETDGELIAQPQ